ncbi:allantoinase AllB [Deinococcus radiomollis]|uniref:allantoinase AllB n=1 Tax=Deinococcus radiomollis TaxID=468916 RepID=UPI003892242C
MLDLIIRGGQVVTPAGVLPLDIGIEGGRVAALEPELLRPARAEHDAGGLHVLPGGVDLHVHFNEPGREGWEGLRSGTSALLAGGATTFGDMPLNSDPPLLDAATFAAKLTAAQAHAHADFAFWGGLTPLNIERLPELAEAGVLGFKAFMSSSGIPEFPAADEATLHEGMRQAAALGLPVAVHAESDELTTRLSAELDRPGASWRDYLNSRPVQAELEAITLALALARETGCRLHVVHVSSGEGAALISEARAAGVDVSAETCPHYLSFTEDDLERVGAALKCAPPLRSQAVQNELWAAVIRGDIQTVGSDHSPCSPDLKTSSNPFEIWGGIPGVQSGLPALLTHGSRHGLTLPRLAELTAQAPARRFRLAGKGEIAPGFDADLALVDLGVSTRLEAGELLNRWPETSPYVGQTLTGRVVSTWLRGVRAYAGGRVDSGGRGRLLRPV